MDFLPNAYKIQATRRLENRREGEGVAENRSLMRERVKLKALQVGPVVGVALEHDVVKEGSWGGERKEDGEGVMHGVGERAAEEELSDDEFIAGVARLEDESVEGFEIEGCLGQF